MVVTNNLFGAPQDTSSTTLDGLFQGGTYQQKPDGQLCFSSHNYNGITTSTYPKCLHDVVQNPGVMNIVVDIIAIANANVSY